MVINNQFIESLAKQHGFDLVGFSKVEKLTTEIDRLKEWIASGYVAGMDYMTKNIEKREDLNLVFEGAVSVISLGMNYYTPDKHTGIINKGKISRYAFNNDYHNIIWEKLEIIIKALSSFDSEFKGIYYVDTGPVMDKVWAKKSGLGWIGKNSNVINRNYGSWFFIANIITNKAFEYSEQIDDFCGKCSKCIDACPTNAIAKPYVVDASKCISYLTIENKGEIPDSNIGKFNGWIFGCDICQDVCPWNIRFAVDSKVNGFYPDKYPIEIDLDVFDNMDNKEFKEIFSESPIKRAKLKGMKRNSLFLRKK